MSYSPAVYVGTGSNEYFTFSWPYLSSSHLYATIDGAQADFTLVSQGVVRITPAPADGTTVKIYRETPSDPIVNWSDGATILGKDLNAATLQSLYITEEGVATALEALDIAGEALNSSGGIWQALSRRIANVADPVNAQDAATKNWAETSGASFVAASLANKTAAEAAATLAEAEADEAATSAAEANAALIQMAALAAAILEDGAEFTNVNRLLDDISTGFNGSTTTFNLTFSSNPVTPTNAAQLLVFLGGSFQTPGVAFTVSGSTITFASAPASGLSCVIVQALAAVPAGPQGPAGADGADGVDGLSAYQVAVNNGFVGTEAAWLASLVGAEGAPGADGADGSIWHSGTGAPSGALGKVTDWYLNDANGDVYEKTGASTWTLRDNLTGPTGPSGPGSGDMSKSTYDTDNDGVVDAAESVPWSGVTGKPTLCRKLDTLTFDGTTTAFTLAISTTPVTPADANHLEVYVGGVRQIPGDAFTVSGSTITFSEAPASGLSCLIILHAL